MGKKRKIMILVFWLISTGLLSLLVERMALFPAKTRQSEAKITLSHISMLQAAFLLDEKRYGRFEAEDCDVPTEIGFVVNCGGSRYQYMIESASSTHFVAVARERVVKGERQVFLGCDSPLDEWQVDQERNIRARFNASEVCPSKKAWAEMQLPSLRQVATSLISQAVLVVFLAFIAFFILLFRRSWKEAALQGGIFALFAVPTIIMGLFGAFLMLGLLS